MSANGKMQVMRVGSAAHKNVRQYAAKQGRSMAEVGDEIVAAGLAALGGAESPAVALLGMEVVVLREQLADAKRTASAQKPTAGDGARDPLLVGAIDAEASELVRAYRDEIAARPGKRAETLTMAETAARLITTGWNRLVAAQKHSGSRA